MSIEKVCFVICPIGDKGTDTRKRSNLAYEYIIKPVVEKFKYKLTRADFIKESGVITSQIIDQIVDSPLVIADLSDYNPNVFYELAIRHTVKKPYIQMIKSGQEIPFDITGMRTISFDIDLESAHNAKKELFNQIKSIEDNNFKPDNPITSAINQKTIFNILTEKGDIEPGNISKIFLESVSELRSMIIDVKSELYHLKTSPVFAKSQRIFTIEEINDLDDRICEIQEEISYRAKALNQKSFDLNGNEIIDQDRLNKILEEIKDLEIKMEYLTKKRNEFYHYSSNRQQKSY